MVAYLLVLFALTLGMFYHPNASRNFVPFRTMGHDIRAGGSEFAVNFAGNLIAFVPMGWLSSSLLRRRRSAGLVGGLSLALSLFVEVLQGISGRRVADVDDLILNTAGGLLGYGLWVISDRLATSWRGGDRPASRGFRGSGGCRAPVDLQEWEGNESGAGGSPRADRSGLERG